MIDQKKTRLTYFGSFSSDGSCCGTTKRGPMKTMRFHLPVLDPEEADAFLDLVTRLRGVVAALVDEAAATLTVVVASNASALLARREVEDALLAGYSHVTA